MDRMDARARDRCPTDRTSPRATRARSRVVAVDASARDDVERGSVSVLSHRFVSKRRRVPVRAPGDGDGDVIVNGARDDVDDNTSAIWASVAASAARRWSRCFFARAQASKPTLVRQTARSAAVAKAWAASGRCGGKTSQESS